MNVMIMTDLEGVSCVNKKEAMTNVSPKEYRYACERLMLDLNAAVDGCLDAGAKKCM